MIRHRQWLLAAAVLPLLYLPLRAAEAPPPDTPAESAPPAAADAPAPATETADAAEVADTAEPAETVAPPRQAAPAGERDAGERLSLDNNLSFPVDI